MVKAVFSTSPSLASLTRSRGWSQEDSRVRMGMVSFKEQTLLLVLMVLSCITPSSLRELSVARTTCVMRLALGPVRCYSIIIIIIELLKLFYL